MLFTSPCSRPWLSSRETGSAVPSRVSLFTLHTQAESGTQSLDFSRFSRRHPFIPSQPPPDQSRVSQVTQLRTDNVHRREAAGTGPLALKIVPVTDAAFSGILYTQLFVHLFFPTTARAIGTPTVEICDYIPASVLILERVSFNHISPFLLLIPLIQLLLYYYCCTASTPRCCS